MGKRSYFFLKFWDESQARTLNCRIVSDNLRKGAATNAVLIAEELLEEGLVKDDTRVMSHQA